MSFAVYADPLRALLDASELGKKSPRLSITPDADVVDKIAAMLRNGLTHGVGQVHWSLRTPIGVRFSQSKLSEIATLMEEALAPLSADHATPADQLEYNEHPWWIEIRT